MPTSSTSLPWRLGLFLLAVVGAYATAWYVGDVLPAVDHAGLVASALTLDLAVGVPVLYYVLLVRGQEWPVFSMVPVFIGSVSAASFLLPDEHQTAVTFFRVLVIPAEGFLLAYVGVRVARATRRFRAAGAAGVDDVLARLQQAARAALGLRLPADVLAFEAALFYYALFTWRTPLPDPVPDAFAYHRRNGYGTVVAGILVALFMETVALHFLLRAWYPAAAWGFTALSLYSVLWIVGDWRAACLRPVLVQDHTLCVRIGLRWTVQIPFAAIRVVRPAVGTPSARSRAGYLGAVLLGAPDYLVELREPVVARGLYGLRKSVSVLGLALDDTAAFEAVLRQRYEAWQRCRS